MASERWPGQSVVYGPESDVDCSKGGYKSIFLRNSSLNESLFRSKGWIALGRQTQDYHSIDRKWVVHFDNRSQ